MAALLPEPLDRRALLHYDQGKQEALTCVPGLFVFNNAKLHKRFCRIVEQIIGAITYFHSHHIYSMQKVEHIGIAVRSLSASIPLFEKLLNSLCYKIETVESEKVNTAFFKTGETKIELLESQEADGVISKFIDKKGEGIHPKSCNGVLIELCQSISSK